MKTDDEITLLLERLNIIKRKLRERRVKNLQRSISAKRARGRNVMKYKLAIKRGKNSPAGRRSERMKRRKNSG